ncbi:UNVERIFIED_ORG: hypothetical protein QFZ59_004659 [Bacillus sp. B2I3]|nr:hypothetical protein [Bacillus sp. B2I3]
MDTVTTGVLIGAGTTLAGTVITSVINIFIAKGQYKRELNKNFMLRKVEAYSNVCKTVATINSTPKMLVTNTSNIGFDWAGESIESLTAIYISECLWLDKKDMDKIGELQEAFGSFVTSDKEETSSHLHTKCHEFLMFFGKRNNELHFVSYKKWWEIWK